MNAVNAMMDGKKGKRRGKADDLMHQNQKERKRVQME